MENKSFTNLDKSFVEPFLEGKMKDRDKAWFQQHLHERFLNMYAQ